MKIKIFKCPFCKKKYVEKNALYTHIETEHSNQIPNNISTSQLLFNLRNHKTHGTCVICGKKTNWNESIEKYERICSEKCKLKYRDMFKKRMIDCYGKVHLLNDPNQQKKMLANRKISGEYTWSDNKTKVKYTGSYEHDFLKFLDRFLKISSNDVIAPAPQTFSYSTPDGKNHFYIPDVYIISLNTIVEIKDGGDNPNTHHKIQDVDKVKEKIKDQIMSNQKDYNYVKVVNKDYSIFLNFLMELKDQMVNEEKIKLPIIRIEEAVELTKNKLIRGKEYILSELTTGIVGDLDKISLLNDNTNFQMLTENKLKTNERKQLSNCDFGIPEDKKFPIHDLEHIKKSIQMFKYCNVNKREKLATNIVKKAYDLNYQINDNNMVWKYTDFKMKPSELKEESNIKISFNENMILNENFSISSDGEMIIKLREKTNFMSKYNTSHKLLKIYKVTNNYEGIKQELCKLWYMYMIIESYYVRDESLNFIQKRLLSKNKEEALKAKAFILNDFSRYLKFILKNNKNFNFNKYFLSTNYYNDVIKINPEKIKAIKSVLKSLIF